MTVYWAETDSELHAQCLTAIHATVSELTKNIQGRGHKLCGQQTYLMTWPRRKFTVVALSDPTGRACTRLKPQENDTPTGRPSGTDEG